MSIGIQLDDSLRIELDLLGKGVLRYPLVDGGTTDHRSPFSARQRPPEDDMDVPFIHLCPDGRLHLSLAYPTGSLNYRLKRALGGPVDGRAWHPDDTDERRT